MGEGVQISRQGRGGQDAALPKIGVNVGRGAGGKIIKTKSALERFASYCAFDPFTGCVMWIGAETKGQGHSQPYGYFWFEGRMVLAHRWSAEHIHRHDITNRQVDHCCPAGASTMCVEHVKPESAEMNRYLQHARPGRAWQDVQTKRYWLFVQKGIEPTPYRDRELGREPTFLPPAWLTPFLGVLL